MRKFIPFLAVLLALGGYALTAHASPVSVHINVLNTTCPVSPESCVLLESSGPTPPATPDLTRVTVEGGATTEHGVYSTVSHTATLDITDTEYGFNRGVLAGLAPNQYLQLTLTYDTTSCSGNLCTIPASGITYQILTF